MTGLPAGFGDPAFRLSPRLFPANATPRRENARLRYHNVIPSEISSHRKTLAILRDRSSRTIEWRRIEALFKALGATIVEGTGSRVRFEINGVVATFHRPHPHKEAKPYQVKDAREFLSRAGVLE